MQISLSKFMLVSKTKLDTGLVITLSKDYNWNIYGQKLFLFHTFF